MTTTWILISVSAALFFLLCISLYYNYRFGRIVLEMQDAIEESLDVMDDHYARISEILEIPLFFDYNIVVDQTSGSFYQNTF